MAIVFACITPHGSEIVEALAGTNPSLMAKTRQSMEVLGRWMQEQNPDTIVVLTPHGLRIPSMFSVSDSERMYGEVTDHDATLRMDRRVDRALARQIAREAALQNLPVARVNFATSEGPLSCLPLDWGVTIPLSFMPNVPIVVVTPARELSFESHLQMGKAVRHAIEGTGTRVGLIASCDWSHAHAEEGPYGFHPDARALDEQVVHWVKENQLEYMTQLVPDFIDNAKPDGVWQALILAGALPPHNRRISFLSYEVPTYFGLLCAGVHVR